MIDRKSIDLMLFVDFSSSPSSSVAAGDPSVVKLHEYQGQINIYNTGSRTHISDLHNKSRDFIQKTFPNRNLTHLLLIPEEEDDVGGG